MNPIRACLAACAFFLAAPALAALPAQVDGQPLPTLAPMLERTTLAVVNVSSKTRVQVRNPFFDDPFFRRFFDMPDVPQERVQQSLGSGVIVDAVRGLVLTNNHVVERADEVTVTLHDGRTLNAEIVGRDPDTDVAVLRVPAQRLTALALADSDRLRVGDFVVAIGNPFGLGQAVTSGIVSALGRSGLRGLGYQNFIQTDASINPGNSGGALVDLRGELVGINTAIFSPSGGNVGIGFAIPANLARNVMNQLLAFGEVKRGSLGVQAQDLDARLARVLGLEEGRGAVVTQVLPDSPADAAGLQVGDVIVRLDGKTIASAEELANAEGLLPIGKALAVEYLREGTRARAELTLIASSSQALAGEKLDPRLAGARFGELSQREKQSGISGVKVLSVAASSTAARNGLEAGDIIFGVNRYEVASLAELGKLVGQRPRQILFSLYRGRRAYYLPIE
ncbi:MAG: Do family serine endopeptidase [Xanthomonadales bacterium PRO6]|nr:Periplasmic pH-dependent serine endoprotease DegQ [Xanthomonadales bacterium]MCE7932270.1 Do family serine endopeptidase [Xanthomonadales bacterium PRO6]